MPRRAFDDLCERCIWDPQCPHGRGRIEAVVECRQFVPWDRARAAGQPVDPAKGAPEVEGLNGSWNAVDLCSSCQVRSICDRPRPPGGVWRCAAYC